MGANEQLQKLRNENTRLHAQVEQLHADLVFCDGTESGPDSATCDCGWCGDPDFTNGQYHCPDCGLGATGFAWDSWFDKLRAETEMLNFVIAGMAVGDGRFEDRADIASAMKTQRQSSTNMDRTATFEG